jgi:outer membrane receptor protein involved in Fe transport
VFKNREALYQFDDAYVVKKDSTLLGTKDSFNPVAGLMYNAVDDFLLLRLAGSIKTRFPDLSEYSLIVDDHRDNGLRPERSYNLNTGFELLFLDRMLSFRNDYFFSRVKDRIEKVTGGIDPPVNIGEVVSQGIESIFAYESMRIADIVTVKAELSYTFIYARVHDDTPEEKVNKGKYLENTPVHQFCADIRLRFVWGTVVALWGYSTINQVAYAMKDDPASSDPFSTAFFEPVRLHDPVMINIRVAQKFYEKYEAYIICKNILDDYNADPFIPGPGRIFYAGVTAEF